MMIIQGNGPQDSEILRYQIKRNVTLLFKRQLEVLEDIIVDHDTALNKINENLPEDYKKFVELADYLSDEKCEQLRKRVIDRGNETIRAIEDILKGFDIKLK